MTIVASVLIAYLVFLVIILIGYQRADRAFKYTNYGLENPMTIVVAMRNEEARIIETLDHIAFSDYPVEVIVVDDHSDDSSAARVREYIVKYPRAPVRLIPNDGQGKKMAITTGVKKASHDIIVTTDADCRMGGRWLHLIDIYFSNENVKMGFGPVTIENFEEDFFSRLQATEFYSVYATSVATWALGFPTMCNGANLVFRKDAFLEVGGYEDNLHVPSGDDEFLMRKMIKRFPDGFVFLYNQDAIVRAEPSATLKEFFYQRIRWAGKWRANASVSAVLIGIFVLAAQLAVPVALSLIVTGTGMLILSILLGLRCVLEAVIIYTMARFFRTRVHWPSFFFLQVFYPFYVIIIGVCSNFIRYRWKGRLHSAVDGKKAPKFF